MRLNVIDKKTGRLVDDDLYGASGWMVDEDGLLLMRDGTGQMRYAEQSKFIIAYGLEDEKDVFLAKNGNLYKIELEID